MGSNIEPILLLSGSKPAYDLAVATVVTSPGYIYS